MTKLTFAGLLQLALLSALRRGELAQLRHDHILTGDRADKDRDGINDPRFHLPPSITKTDRSHDVPLTELMRAVIEAQPCTSSPSVFPSRVGGCIKGWSKPLPPLRDLSGVSFTLHDLRRTVRTLMSRLGVAEDIAELAIGHQRADLIARYNKDQVAGSRCGVRESFRAHQRIAQGRAAQRRWRERQSVRKADELAAGRGDAAGGDVAA